MENRYHFTLLIWYNNNNNKRHHNRRRINGWTTRSWLIIIITIIVMVVVLVVVPVVVVILVVTTTDTKTTTIIIQKTRWLSFWIWMNVWSIHIFYIPPCRRPSSHINYNDHRRHHLDNHHQGPLIRSALHFYHPTTTHQSPIPKILIVTPTCFCDPSVSSFCPTLRARIPLSFTRPERPCTPIPFWIICHKPSTPIDSNKNNNNNNNNNSSNRVLLLLIRQQHRTRLVSSGDAFFVNIVFMMRGRSNITRIWPGCISFPRQRRLLGYPPTRTKWYSSITIPFPWSEILTMVYSWNPFLDHSNQ